VHRPVLVRDGLIAGLEINDAQPRHPEADPSNHVVPHRVRASVTEAADHSFEYPAVSLQARGRHEPRDGRPFCNDISGHRVLCGDHPLMNIVLDARYDERIFPCRPHHYGYLQLRDPAPPTMPSTRH